MKIQAIQRAVVIAILLGVVQCFFVTFCWSYIASHSSLTS